MPKAIKKKPVKKKPIKEDEVKSAALQALEKLRERQRHVMIAASVIVGIALLLLITSLYSASSSRKAYAFEQEAYQYYYNGKVNESLTDEERWNKALELYRKAVDIKVTPSALYYLGNCYYNLKDYDNAIKEYSRFIEKFRSDRLILPLVYQKLASAYFMSDQNEKALDTLKRFAEVDKGLFKDTALVREARYYENSGQKEKALEKYKEIVSAFPASPWSAEAGAKVSSEDVKKTEVSPVETSDVTSESTGVSTPGPEDQEAPSAVPGESGPQ